MVLILLSWIYITFTCVNTGIFVDKMLKLNAKDFAIIIILGLFGTTLFTGFWAIFLRVNWEFHAVLFLMNIIILITLRRKIRQCYTRFFIDIKTLTLILKILLGISTLLILAQSASSPYIIDNETYYIQSLKWLNEYGLVPGLANLHPFLVQMSGWHITQSAFSFSFLQIPFNDLSGYCLLLGNLFAVTKLNAYFQNANKLYLAVGLLPIANVFFFQFISAPSPDLPIYIFTTIIVFYFVENYRTAFSDAFRLQVLLAVFCFYIKPTSVFLLLFPLIYFITHFKNLRQNLLPAVSISSMVLLAFLIKNAIVSGYPLFPFTGVSIDADHTLPKKIAGFYVDLTRHYAFHLNSYEFEHMSSWNLFLHWLSLPGLHGFINKSVLVFITLSPIIIFRFYNRKAVWIVYALMCLQMIFLYLSSPQYRFFFNFMLVFSLIFAALLFWKKTHINLILSISTIAAAVILLVPLKLSFLTQNKMMDANSTFSISTIIYPVKNSETESVFTENQEGNLDYFSPVDFPNFWITGDAPLPAVSREQVEYFRRKFGIVPQTRGESLGDGFYSKRVAE